VFLLYRTRGARKTNVGQREYEKREWRAYVGKRETGDLRRRAKTRFYFSRKIIASKNVSITAVTVDALFRRARNVLVPILYMPFVVRPSPFDQPAEQREISKRHGAIDAPPSLYVRRHRSVQTPKVCGIVSAPPIVNNPVVWSIPSVRRGSVRTDVGPSRNTVGHGKRRAHRYHRGR